MRKIFSVLFFVVCLSTLTFSQTGTNNNLVGTEWRTDGGTLRFVDNSTVMCGYLPLGATYYKEVRSSYNYDSSTNTGRIEYENSTFTINGNNLAFKPSGYYNSIIYQKVVQQ